MDQAQLEILIKTITDAARSMTLVGGVGMTVLTIVLAAAMAAVFHAWGKRIDSAKDVATDAKTAVSHLVTVVSDAATHCRELRAGCREDLLDRFVPREGVKAMDDGVKDVLSQQLDTLKELIADNKNTVVSKFDELAGHLEKFETDMWDALHGHRHADEDGSVIRSKGNPK